MKQLFLQKPFKYTYFRATLYIVLINLAVFVLGFFNKQLDVYIRMYGALNPILVHGYHMYWQFFTYMFVHGSFWHLFFNMFGLAMFGLMLERAIGSKEFLLFYFVTGILSGFCSYIIYMITGQYKVFLMGASGAIYAVLFAYAVVFPRSKIFVWGIIPCPAPLMVGIYAVVEIASQFFTSSNVAHLTHLFGFLWAFLYFLIRMRINPFKIWRRTYQN